ncbi:hypothetical protein FNV43_RR06873 [Rhamnella rubrinervis]|uniref:Uncharacterized protein n=1 Tax=Rhamnella rubrinervis TaxID=2594499 RepID=A0A8K0MLU4_9ROSA|nr:hypothetical protein FNV43_RR06873 [Rhamnella rubrinervis]
MHVIVIAVEAKEGSNPVDHQKQTDDHSFAAGHGVGHDDDQHLHESAKKSCCEKMCDLQRVKCGMIVDPTSTQCYEEQSKRQTKQLQKPFDQDLQTMRKILHIHAHEKGILRKGGMELKFKLYLRAVGLLKGI